jgi:hypothetical protein
MTTETRKPRHVRTTALSATFLVPGLTISGWSLFGYLRTAGAPVWLAVGASASVDGLGLFAAVKAHEFAALNRPAKFAKILTWVMVCGSVLINWQHATTQGWNLGLHVLISLPAAAAAAAFELIMQEVRGEVREKSEPRKRTRRSIKIDADIWLHHPFMVWGARRRESADRLRTALAAAAPAPVTIPQPRPQLEQPAPVVAQLEQPRTAVPAPLELEQPAPASLLEPAPASPFAALLSAAEPPAWASMTIQAAVERADAILSGPNRPGHTELADALTQSGLKTNSAAVRQARTRARKRSEAATAATSADDTPAGATVTLLHPHGAQSA